MGTQKMEDMQMRHKTDGHENAGKKILL